MPRIRPATDVDFGPEAAAIRRILNELRTADSLTFALASVPDLTHRGNDHATLIAWRAARDAGRADAWAAAWEAARTLVRDVPAAVDMAIAEVVRDLVKPEVYHALTASWRAATAVREELRSLGRAAEQLAASLIEVGWTNPVQELPDVARGALAA